MKSQSNEINGVPEISQTYLVSPTVRKRDRKYFWPKSGKWVSHAYMLQLRREKGVDLSLLAVNGGNLDYLPGTDWRVTKVDGGISVGSQSAWQQFHEAKHVDVQPTEWVSAEEIEEKATRAYMSGEQMELDFHVVGAPTGQTQADVNHGMSLRDQSFQEQLNREDEARDAQDDALYDAYVANGGKTSTEERLMKVTVQQAGMISDLQNGLDEKERELEIGANNMGILEGELIELTHLSNELKNRLTACHQRFYTTKTNNDDLPF
tara:strand:- start:72 stop:863 length:792 start_codon:yes stop_codon:yes gene_type:complete